VNVDNTPEADTSSSTNVPRTGRALPLVPHDDPKLYTKLPEFKFDGTFDTDQIALDLIATMRAKKGYGLSANQVGLMHRVFVMDGITPYVCFNPKIVEIGDEVSPALEEGCLSFPGLNLKISRPLRIRVRFTTPNSQVTTKEFMGMTARCFIHETMHLDGYPFFTGVGRLKLERAIKSAKKRGFDYDGQGLLRFA